MRFFFAGFLIGVANLIPGVSGGTMAVLTGVYEKLITSISNILKFQWKDIKLLLVVGVGALSSIFLLSKFFEYSLDKFPFYMYSFFFGLIFASLFYLKKDTKISIIPLLIGIVVVIIPYFLPHSSDSSIIRMIFAGFAGGAAMVIPGLSGSLMMLLFGVYGDIIGAISNFEVKILLIFGIGVLLGIYFISFVMKIAFEKYKNFTKNLILGLVIGSLYSVLPNLHGTGSFIVGGIFALLGYFVSSALGKYMV